MRRAGSQLECRRVGKHYDVERGATVEVLRDVDLIAQPGEFVALVGPSGCGKSTLFNIMAGLVPPTTGDALVDGHSVAGRPGAVAFMPQRDLLFPWLTVLDNAALPLELAGRTRDDARRTAGQHLVRFGLSGFEQRWPRQLSGGMRQRAALLRTYLVDRGPMLLDEPFGALDALTRAEMQEWLLSVWEETRRTVLFETHDVEEALLLSDRIYVMSPRPGRIVAEIRVPFPRPRHLELIGEPGVCTREGRSAGLLARMDEGLRMTWMRVGARSVAALPAIALAGALLIAWEVCTAIWSIPKWLLPSPRDVGGALLGGSALLALHAERTLREALIGLGLAFALGVVTAIVMDQSNFARKAFYPILVTSQTIPIVAIAPLLVIWFGYDILPKILVVALVCFFPIVVATYDGLRAVDTEAIRLVRSMGATRWQIFRRVRWPGALPGVFSGLRIGVTYGMVGAIVGEFVGASRGLGYFLQSSADQMLTERVFAGIVVAAGLSVLLFLIVGLIERLVVPWHRPER